MRHHGLADGLGGDLVLAQALQVAHDLGDGLLHPVGIDIALAQRDLDRARELVAVERDAPAVALDHPDLAELHALTGGEAEAASKAQAAPADRGRILGRTRVLHLGIETIAARTAHARLPRRFACCGTPPTPSPDASASCRRHVS